MAMKDISDYQVLKAFLEGKEIGFLGCPLKILQQRTGQPEKVCYRCIERALSRNLIEYGVSLRGAWLTDEGKLLVSETEKDESNGHL